MILTLKEHTWCYGLGAPWEQRCGALSLHFSSIQIGLGATLVWDVAQLQGIDSLHGLYYCMTHKDSLKLASLIEGSVGDLMALKQQYSP